MKKLFALLLIFIVSTTSYTQDKIFVHTATAANIDVNVTYIDHPDLNNNPNADIVYKHVWNPNGNTGVYNDNIDVLWYSDVEEKWAIYNEDVTGMIEGAQFFIYIGSNSSDFITHIVSVANEHPTETFATVIDDPDFNNSDPGPYAVMSNYYNPNSIYNPHNYGFWYDSVTTNRRVILSEDFDDIPTDAAFRILKNGTGVIARFRAESTATNTTSNRFTINHASLNGNHNATFVFQHYWGVNGASSEVFIDKVLSAYFNGVNWAIYTEDQSPMPEGIVVDIIVAEQEVLGVDENNITTASLFPNPARDIITVSTQTGIDSIKIYNMLGQEVLNVKGTENNLLQVNIASLTPDNYIAKVQTGNAIQNIKLIKN